MEHKQKTYHNHCPSQGEIEILDQSHTSSSTIFDFPSVSLSSLNTFSDKPPESPTVPERSPSLQAPTPTLQPTTTKGRDVSPIFKAHRRCIDEKRNRLHAWHCIYQELSSAPSNNFLRERYIRGEKLKNAQRRIERDQALAKRIQGQVREFSQENTPEQLSFESTAEFNSPEKVENIGDVQIPCPRQDDKDSLASLDHFLKKVSQLSERKEDSVRRNDIKCDSSAKKSVTSSKNLLCVQARVPVTRSTATKSEVVDKLFFKTPISIANCHAEEKASTDCEYLFEDIYHLRRTFVTVMLALAVIIVAMYFIIRLWIPQCDLGIVVFAVTLLGVVAIWIRHGKLISI